MRPLLNILATLGLAVVFAAVGALSTIVVWGVVSLATPTPLDFDDLGPISMWLGVVGPLACWWLVSRVTGAVKPSVRDLLRISSSIGFVVILIVEVVYLSLVSFFYFLYHDVRM